MNKAEFGKRYNNFRNYVYKQTFVYTPDRFRSEDMLFDVFMKLYKNVERYVDENLPALFRKLIRTTFYNDIEEKVYICSVTEERVEAESCDLSGNDNYGCPCTELSLPDQAKLIGCLPPAYRDVFVMAQNGYSYEEISERLLISPGKVKKRIFHVRRILRSSHQPKTRLRR